MKKTGKKPTPPDHHKVDDEVVGSFVLMQNRRVKSVREAEKKADEVLLEWAERFLEERGVKAPPRPFQVELDTDCDPPEIRVTAIPQKAKG